MRLPQSVHRDLDRVQSMLVSETSDLARLEAVAGILQRTVEGCDAASVALLVEDAALTGATTNYVALEADLVQYRCGEGPCLAAVEQGKTVRVDVLRDDERFVHFAPGALAVGVESVWSVPLIDGELTVGSFNLYSTTPHAFVGSAADLAPIAAYAAEVIAGSNLYDASVDAVERIVDAVEELTLVETAIERLVEAGLDPSSAWDTLKTSAQTTGSLVAAARLIILSDGPPGEPFDPRPPT